MMHTQFYQTGGFTIQVNSELPINKDTFHPKFKQFKTNGPGQENIAITHFFNTKSNIVVTENDKIYCKLPWAVYQKQNKIIYKWIQNHSPNAFKYREFVTNREHTKLDTYNSAESADYFSKGMLESISLFPTDQILFSQALAFKKGCILHSLGLIKNEKGYLFLGHSGAGKSTMARIMEKNSVILCDDRNIVRENKSGHTLFGTWKQSDCLDTLPLSAPLKAIFFLNQSDNNQLVYISDNRIRFKHLLDCLVKPLVSGNWWDLTLDFLNTLSKSVDCYDLNFDKSGKISRLIDKLQLH